jgi:hypothetical protein
MSPSVRCNSVMGPYSLPRPGDRSMPPAIALLCMLIAVFAADRATGADDMAGAPILVVARDAELVAALPADSQLLISPKAIEDFLAALEHSVPDWPALYGAGHHDDGLDDRLFHLNRERDEKRNGNEGLSRRITFCWSGTLTPYDRARGGFPVAVGPEFTHTAWGVVRFKPEDLPPNLTAIGAPPVRDRLMERITKVEPIDLKVAMTGHLIPEESIIYDFSHEEEGQGLIMPVVRVEQVQYIVVEP